MEFPLVPLSEVLTQYTNYIEAPETRIYPKLSVKLYGKGVVLDAPVDGTTLKMQRHQIAKGGQVILSEIWGKKGAIGFVPLEGDGALCTSHFFLFDLNPNKILPGYLQAIFTANYLESQLNSEAKGTTGYAAVRPKHLLSAVIPLPPLDEQRRIVAHIEALAAKIEEARGLRRGALEEAEAALYTARQKIYHTLLQECETLPLGKTGLIRGGGTPSKQNPTFWDGDIAWIAPKDMKSNDIREGSLFVSETALAHSSIDLIEPPAVLFVVRGMILARNIPIAVSRIPVTINQDMKAITPFKGIQADFLANMMRGAELTLLKQVENSTHGTKRLKTEVWVETPIPIPESEDDQASIIAHLNKLEWYIEELKELQSQSATELDALLPSILDKAFKGEL